MEASVISPVVENLPFVEASLNYLIPMKEKPVNYTYDPPPGVPQRSGTYETRKLPILNGRLIATNLSLDKQGFVLLESPSPDLNFYDDHQVRSIYYPHATQFLSKVLDAAKVVVFDHNVRNARRAKLGEKTAKEPVKVVHNDFTLLSGYQRARDELAALGVDNIEELLQKRFSIVNLWRPLAEPVQESPIAVCDGQTIALTDFMAADLVYRERVGETYLVSYNPAQRWYYFPQMRRDEVLLLKCFDSDSNCQTRFTAHTAFDDPTSSADAPPRESIELRTLVFY
ncbi:CmcJ/NvfI family oxidoreductase [Gloeothece verrucosa]|uniref:Methyltransferase n=1 Tax=Gloeothece verrucosa (strain PCC 7822) TaxID=497965 RepID=E0U687_GLOV7|nr:CmcJ/NvfI family oxidoreductase [Gloeothece verrucosa]ADN12423.1 conserved hypothetical protein [Gloeothece verrucosa PCC 7822]